MSKIETVYFGHPVNFYDTPKESELISAILAQFPGSLVENPNQPKHQEGYQKYKRETGNGMSYFFRKVLPLMNRGVFLPFEDGMYSTGVFREAVFLSNLGRLVYEINLDGEIILMPIDLSKMLSVEETRERIKKK